MSAGGRQCRGKDTLQRSSGKRESQAQSLDLGEKEASHVCVGVCVCV